MISQHTLLIDGLNESFYCLDTEIIFVIRSIGVQRKYLFISFLIGIILKFNVDLSLNNWSLAEYFLFFFLFTSYEIRKSPSSGWKKADNKTCLKC